MQRKTGAALMAILALGIFALPALSGVQKVVVCEDFTATW